MTTLVVPRRPFTILVKDLTNNNNLAYHLLNLKPLNNYFKNPPLHTGVNNPSAAFIKRVLYSTI